MAMITIHGKQYEPVEDRLVRFFDKYPQGRVVTEMLVDDGKRFIFKASVFRNFEDQYPIATGHDEAIIGSTPINKISSCANSETSSIGRALANAGFAKSGYRVSAEEMQKVHDLVDATPYMKAIENSLDTQGLEQVAKLIKDSEKTLSNEDVSNLRKLWQTKHTQLVASEK